jgi:hypothetical protein
MLLTSIGPNYETKSNDEQDSAVNGPLRIASHVAAGQDVDPLQEKGSASQEEDSGDDV